jgi:hypothetical protein
METGRRLYSLDVELTQTDRVRARRLLVKSREWQRRIIPFATLFIFISGVIIFIEQFGTIEPNGRGPFYLVFVGIVGFVWYAVRQQRRGVSIMQQRTGNRFVCQFDDDGLSMASGGMLHWISWPLVSRFVEDADVFILEIPNGMFYLFPRRCFASPSDQTVFADLARSRFTPLTKVQAALPIALTKLPHPSNVKP